MSSKWLKPQPVDRLTMAFGAGKRFKELLPPMSDIPTDYPNRQKWERLMADWFYSGINASGLIPKEGVDKGQALAHLGTILGSWDPKHEHKEAAVAWLASLWFDENSTWEITEKASA